MSDLNLLQAQGPSSGVTGTQAFVITAGLREKIRLAFVIDCIQDWNLGGTERQLTHLVRSLDPQLFELLVFVLQPSPGAIAKNIGCPVVLVCPTGTPSRVRCLLNLCSALRKFRPHVLQTFFIDGTFYGTAAAWLNRVPVIVQSRRNAGYWQKAHHTLVLRLLNHVVSYWQCNSQTVAGMLERVERIPRGRIAILPNVIDVSHFSPVSDEERVAAKLYLGFQAESPVVVVVSTLRPVKGLRTVVQAASQVASCLPKVQFLIVGEGPDRESLSEEIAASGLIDKVSLIGGRDDVRPWLRAADIGVLASHSESSSNALLEYMAMGLPTVVSDIPANRELVDGEFFKAGDARGLAERILSLWKNAERKVELGRRNRQVALKYSETFLSEEAQSYYLQLALAHCKNAGVGNQQAANSNYVEQSGKIGVSS